MHPLQFLLLEDSPLDAELIQANLVAGGVECKLVQVDTQADFVVALETGSFDLILSDYSLPNFDGISALAIARRRCPEIPFIFVSATLGEELAIEAMKQGATDYVLKQRLQRLVPAVERALRETQARHERQQAELALRQSEARFKRLVQSNLIGCIFWHEDGRILDANDAFLQMVGYTREELEAGLLNWKAMTPIEQIPWSEQSIAQMKRVGSADTLEKEYIRKDGSRVPVLLGGVMFENSQDQGVSFVVDLSDRKQAEHSLKERNERLKLLYETASDLLSAEQPLTLMNSLFKKLSRLMDLHYYFNFLVDESGSQRRLRLASYGGISQQEAASIAYIEFGQYMCGLIAQEGRQIAVDDAQHSTLPKAEVIRALGIRAYCGQPLIVQGRLLGTLSFASLTRTHFTSEELALLQATSDQVAIALERAELIASLQRQTEQLTQANQIKDEFLAVLSHELRTPLNPILGWAKLLQSRSCNAETTTRALEAIERNAKIQTQLIEDLLDVSRILRGKLNLTRNEVDLVSTVVAALETVQLAAEAKKLDIRLEVLASPENPSPHPVVPAIDERQIHNSTLLQYPKIPVLGDASRLQQVIWNLLSNAVKFTPPDGRITVSLSVITKENTQQGMSRERRMMGNAAIDYAQIQVTDTGQGISETFLPHVFEYFRQAEGGTTRKFGGLGLGLAIAQHIVQAHGGTLQADSPGEGQGATFTVQLPLLKTQPEADLDAEPTDLAFPSARRLHNLRVLVVDDEPDTLELIAFLLEGEGAIVQTATCVRAALAIFEEFHPDLLISDIGMPEADGYALLHQLRKQMTTPGKALPAIALTAFARDEDRHRAIAAGFHRHLAKPINPTDLISVMAELLV